MTTAHGEFVRAFSSVQDTLDRQAFSALMVAIDEGRLSARELVSFLCTLDARSQDPDVIASFVSAIRQLSPLRTLTASERAVNVVGTGGGLATFNISTTAAFVAAAAGAQVLKSGSRAYTSACGSLDVLRALGIALPRSPDALQEMLERFGIAFVSESHYPPVFARMAALLEPQSVRRLFAPINRLGPLLSPYRVSAQLIGVSTRSWFDAYAALDGRLCLPFTTVVHSRVGIDELTSCAPNDCHALGTHGGSFTIDPQAYGFQCAPVSELAGGRPNENADKLRRIGAGRAHGAARDTVVLNAAMLLTIASGGGPLDSAIVRAQDAIDAGAVTELLARVREWSLRTFARRAPISGERHP